LHANSNSKTLSMPHLDNSLNHGDTLFLLQDISEELTGL
jgi:hypothetical protein